MTCDKITEYMSLCLDCSISPKDEALLQEHLAGCAACREEYSLLQSISEALRETPQGICAPPGFSAGVAARIAAQKPGYAFKLAGFWKRGMAAAAACLILFGSSYGVVSKYFWNPARIAPTGIVAEQGQGKDIDKTPIGDTVNNGVAGTDQKAGDNQQQTEPDTSKNNNPANQVKETDRGNPDNDKPTRVESVSPGNKNGNAAIMASGPKVFLNQPRSIESTLIKVRVADPAIAKQTMINTAKASNISYQSYGSQRINGSDIEVLRFVADQDAAQGFIGKITNGYQVIDRQQESRDISSKFAETLNQYQSLIEERKTAEGEQAAALDQRIAELERQLTAWDKEAKQQVIVLWLQE